MAGDLSGSARRVQDALLGFGRELRVVELPGSTRSAAEAALAIGCRVEQIAKSLVFKGSTTGSPVLIIASGVNRVNESAVAEFLGEPIERADADFVRQRTGFAIGGIPPLGHLEQLLTVIDEDLLLYDEIWAAAGTPHAVFCLTPPDLIQITGGAVARLKAEP